MLPSTANSRSCATVSSSVRGRTRRSIPVLEEDNVRQGFLEQDQYERLLEELPGHTGARKNELRRIRWDQVDLNGRVIRLPASKTKNKKARTLPIYGDMRRWLKHQRATCPPGYV